MAGLFGAYAAGLLNDFFGIGALLWPCVFAVLGLAHISTTISLHWWRWGGLFLLTLCLLAFASATDLTIGDLSGGGMLGNSLYGYTIRYLSPVGSFLFWLFVLLAGLQLVCNFSWIAVCRSAWEKLRARYQQGGGFPGLPDWRNHLSRARSLATTALNRLQTSLASLAKRPKAIPEIAPFPGNALPEHGPARHSSAAAEPGIDDDDPFAFSQIMQENEPAEPAAPGSGKSQQALIPQIVEESNEEEPPLRHVQQVREPVQTRQAEPPLRTVTPEAPPKRPNRELVLPGFDLLQEPGPSQKSRPEELEARGRALMECFHDFDIQGELVRITPGPVVTRFEMRPAAGIRVSRIANLSDDLGRALKAVAVRIQAPIPGADTVGIEIPNDHREMVNFRELVESPAFQKGAGSLTMVLGKDIAGRPFMTDLARMPHMLVAGATGAGKSVCLNAILISLLYRMKPEQLRLLLVDPKRIEMAVYADLPHLVHPVVTEMEDATNALAWAVAEMENRFKTFMRLGVRNIAAYHEKLASFKNNPPENLADLGPLPYMVIVIDELADLMLTAAREVEGKIQRLAQLARAAGIHMILATQRPSVDVVTGLIKAQFPCRISFQVSSRHDSRTILDEMGAEHLLGRGDMLFKPPGSRLMRLHGPFLSDEEVQAVVDHWKAQQAPDYQVDFSQWSQQTGTENVTGGEATSDALYEEARNFVLEQPRPSISLLQRHLRIGYNRAARLMEQFKREGIVGAEAGRPREG